MPDDAVVWSPRQGDTGDDRYAYDDSAIKAGALGFVDLDLPRLPEVNATVGFNQVIAEVRRRYFLNTNSKLLQSSYPYVAAGGKCRATDLTTPRVNINNVIRYYENRGYWNYLTYPVAGGRILNADLAELRKSLAYEALTAGWVVCRGNGANLDNTSTNAKFCLCSREDEGDQPQIWRGMPLPLAAPMLRPIIGIFNGMLFGPQARFDDYSCSNVTVYGDDGAGNPTVRLRTGASFYGEVTHIRQIGSRLIARGQTKIGSTWGGYVIYSDDWGLTWTRCVFPNFSQDGYTWNFRSITGANILQTGGRLVVAGTTIRADDTQYEHGDAIWYSNDGGSSWTGRVFLPHRDSAFVYAGMPCNLFEYAGRLVVYNVYNGWTEDYYRHESLDGGFTWTRQSFSPVGVGNFNRVWTFSSGAVILHKNSNTYDAPSKVWGSVYRSVDLGVNWTNIQPTFNLNGVCKVGDDLYALIPNAGSGFFDFCRSIDAGGSFTPVCQTDIPINSYRGFPSGSDTTYCNDLIVEGMTA